MGLAKTLFGVTLFSDEGSESEATPENDPREEESTDYLFTWTAMVEVEKTTATIQFVSGKQKRVSYTNQAHNQVFEDATTDAEPLQVNWDNIEYVDTESTETVEIPVEKDRLVRDGAMWDVYQSLLEEESVVTETIDWEEY